jgi:transposase
MKTAYENLSREELIAELISVKSAYELLEVTVLQQKAELAQIKRMIFGTKSERFAPVVPVEQTSLSLDAETVVALPVVKQRISYTREKPKSNKVHTGRLPIPAHIERIKIEVAPDCDVTGLKCIGEEVTEELEYKAPSFYVNQYSRKKYVKSNGEGIIIASLPSRPIEKGIAGPGLLANIAIEKYVDHMPLHRQIQRFKRAGMDIPPATISGWIRGSCNLLVPLYEVQKEIVLREKYLQADETGMPVMDKDKQGATHQGYLWVYHAPEIRMVFFDYRPGRGRDGPREILKDYRGHLQTDGYNAYEIFDNDRITLLHCMAHARRKFDQALNNDKERAEHVLHQMQKLYAIERKAREGNYTHTQRNELRQAESVTILESLHGWFKENILQVLPKSLIGEAIAYSLGRWEKLSLYATDGKLEIDNNLVENVIRPVALGRKNYLFAGNHEAAQRSAMLYSFMGTCKLRGVEPLQWLKTTLSKLPDCKTSQLHLLLP